MTQRDNTLVAVEQSDIEEADRLIANLERENPSHSGRQTIAEAFASYRLRLAGQDRGEGQFSIQEREDDMLIARRDWQFGWRCIARRPKAMTNEEWRPEAERIVTALSTQPPPMSDVRERVGTLFDAIAHGDDVHRAWLREAIDNHFAGLPVPAPRAARQALAHAAVGEGYAVVPAVIQADRDKAAKQREQEYAARGISVATLQTPTEIRRGQRDWDVLVQAAARERLSTAPRPIQPGEE